MEIPEFLKKQFIRKKTAAEFLIDFDGREKYDEHPNEFSVKLINGIKKCFVISKYNLIQVPSGPEKVIDFESDQILCGYLLNNNSRLSVFLSISLNFFWYNPEKVQLGFSSFDRILDIYIYNIKTDSHIRKSLKLEFWENVFTSDIYFYRKSSSDHSLHFEPAASLNRMLLRSGLNYLSNQYGGIVSEWSSEMGLKVNRYGIPDDAKLEI